VAQTLQILYSTLRTSIINVSINRNDDATHIASTLLDELIETWQRIVVDIEHGNSASECCVRDLHLNTLRLSERFPSYKTLIVDRSDCDIVAIFNNQTAERVSKCAPRVARGVRH